ncbi:winged helix-turn-helix transcriptional regulator [Furfurilactobacillus rossiae]
MGDEDKGLRYTTSVLAGTCRPLIVTALLDGSQSLLNLYQHLPKRNLCSFVFQLCSLWRNGLIQLRLTTHRGLSCRLTKAGQSTRPFLLLMAEWGKHRREAATDRSI